MDNLAKKYEAIVLKIAGKSPCKKRKVGAILVDLKKDIMYAEGYNYRPSGGPCEEDGVTFSDVVHAEIVCIESFIKAKYEGVDSSELTMFVTHPPCNDCLAEIKKFGCKLHIVGAFMKFDTNKLRYDLLPPFAIQEIVKVLTYGAKKYKPNNWRQVDDINRYIAAAYRHIEAWRLGEDFDKESNLHHLSHAATNLIFLVELIVKKEENHEN